MSATSPSISWCDASWNPISTGETRFIEKNLELPLHWKKRRRISVNSMSDLFHESVPDGWAMRILHVMAQTPRHTYQILTKRPDRMCSFFTRWADLTGEDYEPKLVRGPDKTRKAHPSPRGQLFAAMLEAMGEPPPGCAYPTFDWLGGMIGWPLLFHNIWPGISCENQATADERIPWLLKTPAAVRFLFCESLLAPIRLARWFQRGERCRECGSYDLGVPEMCPTLPPVCRRCGGFTVSPISWVICGGESGAAARPCDVAWLSSVVRQCQTAGVACFVKQLGSKPYEVSEFDRATPLRLRDTNGADPVEWPENLRVRQFPPLQETRE